MKKVLLSLAVMAVAGAAYVGVNTTSTKEASLLTQNVAALASGESGAGQHSCYYSITTSAQGASAVYCGTCRMVVNSIGTGSLGVCYL